MSDEKCLQDLPVEVLEMIFDFLELTDRKLASQVCRMWEPLAFSPKMLKKVMLSVCFDEGRGRGCSKYRRVLRNSQRRYRHITFHCSDERIRVILAIVENFRDSLSTLTITGDILAVSVKDIEKLFGYITGLQELRVLCAVTADGETITEQTAEIQLPNLPALKTLFLSQDSLESEGFNWREIAPDVEKLYVTHESRTASTVYDLLSFYSSNLRNLGLSTWMSEEFYKGLGEVTFPGVRKLTTMCQGRPSFALVKRFFERFTGLTELNYGFYLTSETLFYIARRFPTLTTIRIYDGAPPELFTALSELPQLQHITLVKGRIQPDALSALNPLPKVTEFYLKCTTFEEPYDEFEEEYSDESETFYKDLAVKMPQLTRFGIADVEEEGRTFYPIVFDHLRDLTHLTICLDDYELENAFTKLHQLVKLTDLRLSIEYDTTSSFSWLLFPVCPSIRRMQLDVPRPKGFKKPEVVDREWKHLAERLPSLEKLQIARSYKPLTEQQLNSLRTMMPRCAVEMVSKIELFPFDADDGCLQLEVAIYDDY